MGLYKVYDCNMPVAVSEGSNKSMFNAEDCTDNTNNTKVKARVWAGLIFIPYPVFKNYIAFINSSLFKITDFTCSHL